MNAFSDELYKAEVKHVGKVVGDFRKVAKYIRKSTIAKEKLNFIQTANGNGNAHTLDLDVRTRWNSTLSMLLKFVKLKTSLCIFLQYLKSAEGKREFNRKRLPTFYEEHWALIKGLCIIVSIFATATEVLSGEKYPTFVYSMPILRSIKMHLSNEELLSNGTCQPANVAKFLNNYATEPFMPSVIKTLETNSQRNASRFQETILGHDN